MLRVAVAPVDPAVADDAPPAWMGASERVRWAGLGRGAQAGFTASRALLRGLLQDASGVAASAWVVSAEPGAAPVARSPRAGRVHASLSHRLGWVAAAVSDTPVGIDLERERGSRSDPDDRAALILAAVERTAWDAVAPAQRERALLTRWTAKEAWFKATPPGAAPWDFRRLAALACAPAQANVRTWDASPLHLAVCSADAGQLAEAWCDGLDAADGAFWHVAPVR